MKVYQCPNCGRQYNNIYYCMNCNYPLKPIEEVKNIKHPELNTMLNDNYVIGTVSDPTKPAPKCPTCQSPNVEKISLTSKVVGGALFGLFSSNVRKTMHCKNCGYKW